MQIIRSVDELIGYVAMQKNHHQSIGLVPTMGALHDGHISLVERAVADNACVIVSVFVNPTQFNNPDDLRTYPRTEEADVKLLAKAGATAVFLPSVEEIYPDGAKPGKVYDLGEVAEVMEGRFRPGHFQGVAQIVSRLFELCRPNRAYFGEKDFQQIAVIKRMTATEGLDVEIVECPIRRAPDGLALSSRNTLLTEEQRQRAPRIYEALSKSVEYSLTHSVSATHDTVVEELDAVPDMKVEYFEIVDAQTLIPVEEWDESPRIQGCITVFNGKVRLIDNICYRPVSRG